MHELDDNGLKQYLDRLGATPTIVFEDPELRAHVFNVLRADLTLNDAYCTDRPLAALLRDLGQGGLLDSTLVVWGGEFGRTPMVQGGTDGRDHHNRSFSMWLAGGGVKAGHVHGATDELGFNVTEGALHVHDLNATLLHLLGLDHTRLTYRFQGRDYRLTDVFGMLVKEVLA